MPRDPDVTETTKLQQFEEIVKQYQQQIFRLAYHLTGNTQDAEDLSQEAFIKGYQGFDRFRGDAQIGSWLYRITVNTWIDARRKKHYTDRDIQSTYREERKARSEPAPDPEHYMETSFLQQCIENALEQLSPREKSVFVLRHYHQYKLKEIGSTLQISEGTVKSLLYRAVQKLRDYLNNYRKEIGL